MAHFGKAAVRFLGINFVVPNIIVLELIIVVLGNFVLGPVKGTRTGAMVGDFSRKVRLFRVKLDAQTSKIGFSVNGMIVAIHCVFVSVNVRLLFLLLLLLLFLLFWMTKDHLYRRFRTRQAEPIGSVEMIVMIMIRYGRRR